MDKKIISENIIYFKIFSEKYRYVMLLFAAVLLLSLPGLFVELRSISAVVIFILFLIVFFLFAIRENKGERMQRFIKAQCVWVNNSEYLSVGQPKTDLKKISFQKVNFKDIERVESIDALAYKFRIYTVFSMTLNKPYENLENPILFVEASWGLSLKPTPLESSPVATEIRKRMAALKHKC